MAEFANISKDERYPRREFDGTENQSYGFVEPSKLQTGILRGTQRIINTDGSFITIGLIPGTTDEFGMAFFDVSKNLISKSTGVTDYKYDISTGKNYYQNGKLPDGSYGAIYAKTGYDVEDVIS